MTLDKTAQALIALLRCSLYPDTSYPIPEFDHNALFALSKFHSVAAMTAMALETRGLLKAETVDEAQIKMWQEARVKAVRKNILLDAEREQILKFMEEQGIWYMPLKGCLLKDMYPKMGMREMADNDILYDKSFQKEIYAFMIDRGYVPREYGKGYHDSYEKAPIYNYEFHNALFSGYVTPLWAEYYQNVKERLLKDTNNEYGYHFCDEDFYIYFLLHAKKHYSGGGTGIRLLLDTFLYLQKKAESMDWNYIEKELSILESVDFEKTARSLTVKLFGQCEMKVLSQEEQEMITFLMGAGAYGTTENLVKSRMASIQQGGQTISLRTKARYVLWRMFPDTEFMKLYSPFCEKHPWSIPFFWVYRLAKAAVFRRKAIRAEIDAVKK